MKKLAGRSALAGFTTVNTAPGAKVFLDGAFMGQGPRVAMPCSAGQHELMVVTSSGMNERTIQCPAAEPIVVP